MRQQITQVHGVSSEDLINEIVTLMVPKLSVEIQTIFEKFNSKLPEELINGKEACKILDISNPTLLKQVKLGKIPVYKAGNQNRYKRSEVENSIKLIK